MVSFWPRINTVLLLLTLLAVIGLFATRAYGGPLDPPGPPAPTDGVREPGTPISSLPFSITQPGHYYVTRDLNGNLDEDGITITTSNVTLDLGDFTLLGDSGSARGIVVTGGVRNVAVRNGSVRGWDIGIDARTATHSRISGIRALGNTLLGIAASVHSEISDCNASLNEFGLQIEKGVIRNCVVTENSISGIQVLNNSLVEGTYVHANPNGGITIDGDLSTLRDNEFSENTTDVEITAASAGTVLISNAFCIVEDHGTNTAANMNVVHVGPC